jgi:DNA-binding beta-propeller fold protein YncE
MSPHTNIMKGTNVKPTERTAKTPHIATGLFATLLALPYAHGSGARSHRWLPAATLVVAILAVLACMGAPAFAVRGHVFERSFGEKGKGAGQLEEPAGLAVSEATGDVYVVDTGGNRVERFNSAGAYQSELTGPSATGVGALKAGSVLVEAVTTETGAFTVGEEISAPGLPAETKIVAVKEAGVLEVSREASASELAASLTAHQPFFLPFGGPIAVDNACAVHKLAEPACKEFDPSNGDLYVASGEYGEMVIDKFSAAGSYMGQLTGSSEGGRFGIVLGVAVDQNGRLWVTQPSGGRIGFDIVSFDNAEANAFIPPLAFVNGTMSFGLAVDSEDNLYVDVSGETGHVEAAPIWKVSSTGGILERGLDPESFVARNGVATELPSNDFYVDDVFGVKRFAPNGSEVEAFGESQMANVACQTERCIKDGLAVNSSTGQVYVSLQPAGVVLAYKLEPTAAPVVKSDSVLEIASESATFEAEIEPRSISTEAGTTYRFEYGACSSLGACASSPYESSTPLTMLPASFEVDPVVAHVQGLAVGKVYHFRVVAENGHGPDEQATEHVFTTQGVGAFALPDGRAWEMVSPAQKNGALIEPIGGPFEGDMVTAAADGSAMTFATRSPTEPELRGYSNAVQVLSVRGPGGWRSLDLPVAHKVPTGLSIGQGQEYRFFSEDLSLAVVQPFGAFEPALSGEATEQTAFLHSNYGSGGSGEFCTSLCYRPFVTAGNATSGEPFGEEGCPPHLICGPVFVGATPDLGHVVLSSHVALTVGGGGGEGLYEWSGGGLAFIGTGVLGVGTQGDEVDGARHAISDDGSRVFFSSRGESRLFMRDMASEKTVQLDVPEAGCLKEGTCGGGRVQAEFQFASSDGSRVFFADTQSLTGEAGAYPEDRGGSTQGGDLYECEVREDACKLTDLAPAGNVLGTMPGASEDGSWVYFVANGVLENSGVPVPGAVQGSCPNSRNSQFASGVCNLYVRHEGVTRLVAVLSGADVNDWAVSLADLVARVSPNGRWLAFMSQRSLTGYDNRDAVSGKRDQEVFLYDGQSGRLVCASCNPTGARPHGVQYGPSGANLPLVGGDRVWESTDWLAANVPGWTRYTGSSSLYQSRYLSDSGRLFFNAGDALVPRDVNGREDVYEYEPAGVGPSGASCGLGAASGSIVFKAARGLEVEGRQVEEGAGCVGLVSSGASSEESAFLDASLTGGDVFFMTTAQLSSQDFDIALDIYDAHECTSLVPCSSSPALPPPCVTAEGCRAAPVPQPAVFGAPSSATFSGTGNLLPASPVSGAKHKSAKCKRGFVKRKRRCVRKKSRAKRAKRSARGARHAKGGK